MSRDKISKVTVYFMLSFWALLQIFPIYYMFTFSLKDNDEIFGENIIGLPEKWLWSNYEEVLTPELMGKYFLNSVIVTVTTILVTAIVATMASYVLTRMQWKGRKAMNAFFMLGLTVPLHAAILPVFVILNELKMRNSYQALIIPYTAFSLTMAILICNGFMKNIPNELEEAACIDGCSVYGIFIRIIAPLMKPAISTVSIFVFLQAWNELMFAVIFIDNEKYRTLTVGIQELSGAHTVQWGPIGAALVVATFPTLIVYFFMSKKIQESMVVGAIKG